MRMIQKVSMKNDFPKIFDFFYFFYVFFSDNKKRAHHLQFQKQHLYSSYLNGSGRSQRLENSKYIDC